MLSFIFKSARYCFLFVLVFTFFINNSISNNLIVNNFESDSIQFVEYKGKIIDESTRKPLSFALIKVVGNNVSVISNSDGYFSLKLPKYYGDTATICVSYIGYKSNCMALSDLIKQKNKIALSPISITLPSVSVEPKDPLQIMREVIASTEDNYMQKPLLMTAFYREMIKKRRNYVALAEAVVDVYKKPYLSPKSDAIKLYKSRKEVKYSMLDTVLFKLQAGPYSCLMLDVVNEPYSLITSENMDYYNFTLSNITSIDNKTIGVIEFKQKPYITDLLFYGKLYVDLDSYAIVMADYSINIEDKQKASNLFIKKCPPRITAYPIEVNYFVKYQQHDKRWLISYSRGQISFKVKKKRKLFNNIFTSIIEMSVTDWDYIDKRPFKYNEQMKRNVILQDNVIGFADPVFWQNYNVIEPETPIENVIKKIKKQLDRRLLEK